MTASRTAVQRMDQLGQSTGAVASSTSSTNRQTGGGADLAEVMKQLAAAGLEVRELSSFVSTSVI